MACVRSSGDDALEHQVVLGGDLGAPAGFDHDGLVRLDDDGGPIDAWPGASWSRVKTPASCQAPPE